MRPKLYARSELVRCAFSDPFVEFSDDSSVSAAQSAPELLKAASNESAQSNLSSITVCSVDDATSSCHHELDLRVVLAEDVATAPTGTSAHNANACNSVEASADVDEKERPKIVRGTKAQVICDHAEIHFGLSSCCADWPGLAVHGCFVAAFDLRWLVAWWRRNQRWSLYARACLKSLALRISLRAVQMR